MVNADLSGAAKIGDSAFEYCHGLKNVTLENTLTRISFRVFENAALESITFKGTIAEFEAIPKDADWKAGVPGTVTVHCTDGDLSI